MKTSRNKLHEMYSKAEVLEMEMARLVRKVLGENGGNVKENKGAVRIANHFIGGMEIKEVGLNASWEIIAYLEDSSGEDSKYIMVSSVSGLYNVIGFLINNVDYLKDKIDFLKTIEPGDIISVTINKLNKFTARYAGFRIVENSIRIYHNGALGLDGGFIKESDTPMVVVYGDSLRMADDSEKEKFFMEEKKTNQ